jgi:hypothetical protein
MAALLSFLTDVRDVLPHRVFDLVFGGERGITRAIHALALRAPFGREKPFPTIFSNQDIVKYLTILNLLTNG